jgi:Ca-activated chloride channel family protein
MEKVTIHALARKKRQGERITMLTAYDATFARLLPSKADLQAAGFEGQRLDELVARAERAATLLQSFFERVPMEQVRLSVIATYTSAKPVVIDTRDVGVVKNILTDLPLSHAFAAGSTDLFSGLAEAARVAQAWPRDSTTVVVVSDGDTVPPSGMPEMPPSVSHTVLIGLGDPRTGQFINGHQSRQDAATLKQVAIRLRGVYHDGNQKHLPSDLLRDLPALEAEGTFKKLTRREYALAARAIGAATLAALPWALHFFGTSRQTRPRGSREKERGHSCPLAE